MNVKLISAIALTVTMQATPLFASDRALERLLHPAVAELESKHDIFHRIGLAETQLALVEEMSEAACMVAKGIEVEEHLEYIRKFRDRYLQVHKGLLEGDESLGLMHPEEKAKVIKAFWKVEKHWNEDYAPAINHVLETGELDDNDAYELFDHDKALIEALSIMVTEVEAEYANPFEVKMDEALTMEILARQEFLLEAVAKDVCVVSLGYHSDLHRKSLQEELQVFEASHDALVNGLPGAILPAPTEEIRDGLERFGDHWKDAKPYIDKTLGGSRLEDQEMIDFEHLVADLLHELEEIVVLYENLH